MNLQRLLLPIQRKSDLSLILQKTDLLVGFFMVGSLGPGFAG
jgi:hypothetical protein